MNKYENLLAKCEHVGVNVYEKNMFNKGLYCDGYVWINRTLTNDEKCCILAEELGHHYTTSGDILNQSVENNRIQEKRARVWAYCNLLKQDDIIKAIKQNRCRNHFELAEELGVSEDFLKSALEYYQNTKPIK